MAKLEANMEVCRQAYSLNKNRHKTWAEIEPMLGFKRAHGRNARRAAERWEKWFENETEKENLAWEVECMENKLCVICGTKKNYLNMTTMCQPCHDAIREPDINRVAKDARKKVQQELDMAFSRYESDMPRIGAMQLLASIGRV